MHTMTQHDEQGVGAEVAGRSIRASTASISIVSSASPPITAPVANGPITNRPIAMATTAFWNAAAVVSRTSKRSWRAAGPCPGRVAIALAEARDAVRDGWHHIERNLPHALDRPLR
ncbi:hypothetical protein [Lysobacter capsici]|uniref:hypothetical protein n=1 Tax=Lysobacter capsici TaxID=435897 RepID=UPI000BBB479C|nr:hypothetical protein [Lysobacter capsici]ATE74090.1 hypothetical protein CNO08_23645 [Lysobacter capsici]